MWSRSCAGALLGFTLACALAGLYAVLGPQARADDLVVAVMVMFPLWIAAWTSAYTTRSATRAWLWLGAANLVSFLLLALARSSQGWGA